MSLEERLEASIKSPPVGRVARTAVLVMLLTLIPLFGWATMTTMERAVLAPGFLIPEGRKKTVNLLEAGILRRLLVREGQIVDAGQPLAQLDVTQAEAQADQARAQFWSGRAKIARLRAEHAESRTLIFPDDVMRAAAGDPAIRVFLEAEQALFGARWEAFDGAIAVQQRNIAQFQEQITGVRAQREASEAQLRSAREQLAGMRTLQQQGLVSLFRLQEMQRLESSYIGSIGQFSAQESQLREQVQGAEKQLAGVRLTRLQEIATELQAAETLVATAAQQMRATEDILARREVLSPEAGKVANILAFTPGSTIASGQAILDLVPVRDRFIVEMQVMPTDIEQVMVGQRVNMRLTSYRMRQVPMIGGRVIHVAADITALPSGTTYFLARAELDLAVLEKLPDVTLQAGMPAEVYVLGEERTPLDYFWAPFRSAARRAFRD
ncbi:MAG: HlyD family type I secretion periplasmic adaptor subunit [Acetobacteraceae bacterium]|nr:HlyD family type I secretion periplasmic adaptor subunit [Acetobacteraceae bacterium]